MDERNFLHRISPWLEPVNPDPALAYQERMLYLILAVLAPAGVLFGIGGLVSGLGVVSIWGAVAGFGTLPVFALAYFLARRGHLQAACLIPPIAILAAPILGNILLGTGHFIYAGYLLAIVIAVLLAGARLGAAFALLSLLSHLAVGAWLETGAFQPVRFSPTDTVFLDGLGLGLISALAIATLTFNRSETQRRLRDERQRVEELDAQAAVLEQQVWQSQQDLQRRLAQIRAAAEVTSTIGRVLDPDTLLEQVVKLVKDRFDLYYVGVFLLDAHREYAVLRAGTGEAGARMVAEGHKLAVGGESMIGHCILTRRARIALDVGQEAIRFNNPYLWKTRSELALPVQSGETVLGAMTIQSDVPAAFDQDDILVFQSVADSLATALENARLFAEAEASLRETQSLHRQYLQRAWSELQHSQEGKYRYTFEERSMPQPVSKVEVPLVLREQVIGYLELETDRPGLSAEEQRLVEAVAAQATQALENARLIEETQARAARERVLNEMTAQMSRSLDLDALLRTAVQELGQIPQVVEVSVHVGPASRQE